MPVTRSRRPSAPAYSAEQRRAGGPCRATSRQSTLTRGRRHTAHRKRALSFRCRWPKSTLHKSTAKDINASRAKHLAIARDEAFLQQRRHSRLQRKVQLLAKLGCQVRLNRLVQLRLSQRVVCAAGAVARCSGRASDQRLPHSAIRAVCQVASARMTGKRLLAHQQVKQEQVLGGHQPAGASSRGHTSQQV